MPTVARLSGGKRATVMMTIAEGTVCNKCAILRLLILLFQELDSGGVCYPSSRNIAELHSLLAVV